MNELDCLIVILAILAFCFLAVIIGGALALVAYYRNDADAPGVKIAATDTEKGGWE